MFAVINSVYDCRNEGIFYFKKKLTKIYKNDKDL